MCTEYDAKWLKIEIQGAMKSATLAGILMWSRTIIAAHLIAPWSSIFNHFASNAVHILHTPVGSYAYLLLYSTSIYLTSRISVLRPDQKAATMIAYLLLFKSLNRIHMRFLVRVSISIDSSYVFAVLYCCSNEWNTIAKPPCHTYCKIGVVSLALLTVLWAYNIENT